jgi:hypothetical protein
MESLFLTSFSAFPNAHAKPLLCQIDNCYYSTYLLLSQWFMCFSFEALKLTVLKYIRAAYLLQGKYIVLVTVVPYKEDYLVYKFLSSNRLQWTSKHITVQRGLFGVQICIFNRLQWTSNSITVQRGLFGVQISTFTRLQWTSNHITVQRGLFGVQILIFK